MLAAVASDYVALMQRQTELWNSGDIDEFMALFADDAEVLPAPEFIEGGVKRGSEEIRGFYAGLRQAWEDTTVIDRDLRALGDQVIQAFEWRATGEASGIETSSEWVSVITFRAGRIARVQFFSDPADAIEAAGVTPEETATRAPPAPP
jgi:ketosteroid isomerase-like protein